MGAIEIVGDAYVIVGDASLASEDYPEVQSVELNNDFINNCIRAKVVLTNGLEYKVKVPLGRVIAHFEKALESEGVAVPDTVSGHDTLAGFYDEVGFSFKKLGKKASGIAKKATRGVARTATKAVTDVSRGRIPLKVAEKHRQKFLKTKAGKLTRKGYGAAKKTGVQAARSKALGAVLAVGSAIPVVNAVSGPALAAWTIANRADAIAMAAKRASDNARKGNFSAVGKAVLDAAATQNSQLGALRNAAPNSAHGLVRSALQTIPAGSSIARSQAMALGIRGSGRLPSKASNMPWGR